MSVTAEELIAKVRVDGMAAYVSAMKTAESATTSVARSIMRLAASPMTLLSGAVGVGGLLAFGRAAVQAASDLEELRAVLIAITGSAAIADQKLNFMRKLAIPSKFTFGQLSQAGVQLEAFGLRTEKVLPLIAKLGMAFKADSVHMEELVRMFGELSQGKMPELEQLTAFGLSRAQFAQQGVKFDANGKLLSDVRSTMEAFSRIINSKYGNIFEQMQSTTAAKFSSLTDMWEQAMAKIGQGIITVITPYVETITSFLNFMVNGGVLDNLATKFIGVFATGQRGTDNMVSSMSFLVALMENMPGIFDNAFSGIAKSWNVLKTVFLGIVDIIGYVGTFVANIVAGLNVLMTNFLRSIERGVV